MPNMQAAAVPLPGLLRQKGEHEAKRRDDDAEHELAEGEEPLA